MGRTTRPCRARRGPREVKLTLVSEAGERRAARSTRWSGADAHDDTARVNRHRQPVLTVTFHKEGGRSPHAWWEAVRSTRGRVIGGYMPIGRGRIPHDLGHMATEAHLEINDGFWGLLARGATFDHGTQQRRTKPGRQLIRENREALRAAEAIGNHHHSAWALGNRHRSQQRSTGSLRCGRPRRTGAR